MWLHQLKVINETRKNLDGIEAKIAQETQHQTVSKSIINAKNQIKNVEQAWDCMTDIQKRNIIQSVVKRIVITGNDMDVDYKF